MQKAEKKKTKSVQFVPLIIILTVIISLVFLTKFFTRTIPNKAGTEGNTACNLYNGGLFCLYDDKIYFSNPYDDGALCSMNKDFTNVKHLNDDQPGYLNAAGHYLVYARMNYKREGGGRGALDFTSSGLFRVNRSNGKGIIMYYSDPVGLVAVNGNDIFYQHYDKADGIDLYRARLDNSSNQCVENSPLVPGTIVNGQLYFTGTKQNHYLYCMDTANYTESLVYKGNCYRPARIQDSIYFISLTEDYSIARVNAYGSDPTLLVKKHCSEYNVDDRERYLVYQVDDGLHSRLEVLDLNSYETTTIKEGNFNSIHILDDLVLFREFNSNQLFFFHLGETSAKPFEIK